MRNLMKSLILSFLLSTGFFAQAMMNDSFVSLSGGVDFNNSILIQASFGDSIISAMENYYGFYEIGARAEGILKDTDYLLSAKYGYEFMRQNRWSFGLDMGFIFGVANNWNLNSLGYGVEAAIFSQFKVTDNLGVFVRLNFFRFSESDGNSTLIAWPDQQLLSHGPFAEVGLRWYL